MRSIIYDNERTEIIEQFRRLQDISNDTMTSDDLKSIRGVLLEAVNSGALNRGAFDLNPILFDIQTALITVQEIGLSRASIISILLHDCVALGCIGIEKVEKDFGADAAHIIRGLIKVNELYSKNPSIETENFRDLLLSFAEDMRVIFIMIAARANLMRQIKDRGTDEERKKVATEAIRLYAPLAHKLGLYLIKSELEDLSLKYLEHDAYYMIKDKLNETKKKRDEYIRNFIAPIESKLAQAGLKFHVKGRTKSIHSIWQKMKKQKCQFEGIYDLFAIRIILDSEPEKEKQDCWQVFSIVTDMYRPNPKRLRDWLSVPKSNGYESLHITVMGPEGKWVEIQIRTERMDEIAEKGLAAHWRYKGVKSSNEKMEDWLKDIRLALESHSSSDEQLMDQFKVDLYSDEVFVFTPKGDLFKLPKGATVLDFAFQIHTNVGSRCSGGKINGKNVPMRTKLQSGDQVEILTSQQQMPKRDWLNYAVTTKAKTKIRQSISEQEMKTASFAKETIERKFKNKKIEYDEPVMMRLITRMGYKHVTEFYKAIAEEVIDVNAFIERYIEAYRKEHETTNSQPTASADTYVQSTTSNTLSDKDKDILVIDQNIKGVEYSLAKCCTPIYGDEVFGFVTANRGIKIHRNDCPNAQRLKENLGYRIIPAKWAGKGNSMYAITLRIIGHDDIGIVNNITSIIAKEKNVTLRSIDIKSSEDGLFAGTLTIMIDNTNQLNMLIKKIRTVKGVKNLVRL
ncbi:MAG: bifunctional (p)ppGpp synthetase/guanosine-3',5'-bis(diphosphate) 3'-pyrophosphohydrolase [Bacteroidaceae bacterium]|nr:bifunctional (p)ppGpp synthetase/guanosine-3',5'-bis(diphosphate) 3'-pyrophosphohydrolase [Bacteroidaceae bacterium]